MRGPRRMPELPFALKPEPSVEGRSQTNLCFLCSNQSATVPCSASIFPELFNTASPPHPRT
jgi:hypothetical protein